VHGLGFSPDSKTVAVVCVGSNSVTLIESISVLRKFANLNIFRKVSGGPAHRSAYRFEPHIHSWRKHDSKNVSR